MNDYGFWSVLPPVIAIFLAIKTRQVFIALLFGIGFGWLIMDNWNPIQGAISTVQGLVDVFKDEGNTRTIMFSALVGVLIVYIQRSGGVEGFIFWLEKKLQALESGSSTGKKVWVQIIAGITGVVVFVESSISVLTVGTLYRPVFDKMKISREKLAYIADSSSAPACILIPFNAWGAYIMGLLLMQGFDEPFKTMFYTIPFNFYPILALTILFLTLGFSIDIGPMKKAEKRTRELGKLLNDDAQPVVSAEATIVEKMEGSPARAINMILPIGTMVMMMPLVLFYTGSEALAPGTLEKEGFFVWVIQAIGKGSGSAAVLYAVITAIVVSGVVYRFQKIMKLRNLVDDALKGISALMPLALLMLLAFAIGNVCRELGTGHYVAEITRTWLSPNLVPAIIFLVSAFIAFSTGTSWGTFAIMISIGVPMAQGLDANVHMAIAAALGGGVFGDHCSPISDTTILASMAAATDHVDHVRTQLPYVLIGGGLSLLLYLLMGYLF